ncbi:PRD domain-containing protein [Nocardioides sp.]|uniref:PRD domain-containing protein n=1 Tax=Nocardioides sp. TaxID=35761 RepID=UPI0026062875|nr:PRD domain-containing protein [Nocardioides sp.]MCW2736851.1 putative transcriptional antiterminator [Nocardioides sp.]
MRDSLPAPTVEAMFQERLDLLEEAHQITPLARRLTEFMVAELAVQFELELDEESGALMVTHLAMALTRLNRGEVAAPVSESLERELAGRVDERDAVARLMQEASEVLGREVPETEILYMTLHLTSLVLKR